MASYKPVVQKTPKKEVVLPTTPVTPKTPKSIVPSQPRPLDLAPAPIISNLVTSEQFTNLERDIAFLTNKIGQLENKSIIIPIKLLSPNATLPKYSKADDAAMDLYASLDVTIPYDIDINSNPVQLNSTLVSTHVSMAIPVGYYGRVAPRSGLSCKGIGVGAGVVDAGYRGHIKVLLINNGAEDFKVSKGDRIAQLIITKIADNPQLQLITDGELPESDRGDDGFGSTGR